MDATSFAAQLALLNDADWQAVVDGQAVLLVDDQHLAIGPAQAANAVIGTQPGMNAATLRRRSLADAAELLRNYYLTHPLTLAGFNRQVEALIERYGAAAFAALAGHLPPRTLFVDGGEIVAEPPDSPRHRYGAFCELQRPLSEAAAAAEVRRWLSRGEAHERYLGMNVCRYNC